MYTTGVAFDFFDLEVKTITKRRWLEDCSSRKILEGAIYVADVRRKLEDSVKTLEILSSMAFPVGFIVLLCGSEQAGRMLENGIRSDIALKAECILNEDPQVIHTLVQQADDMEAVRTDASYGEA